MRTDKQKGNNTSLTFLATEMTEMPYHGDCKVWLVVPSDIYSTEMYISLQAAIPYIIHGPPFSDISVMSVSSFSVL